MGQESMSDLDPQLPLPSAPGRAAPPPPPVLRLARSLLWVSALASLCGVVLLAATVHPPARGFTYAVLYSVLALAAVAATRVPEAWLGRTLTLVLGLQVAALMTTSIDLRGNLNAPGLSVTGLVVCLACVGAGWRAGALLAALSAAALVVLTLPPLSTPMLLLPSAQLQLGTQLVVLAAGLAGGALVARLLNRTLRALQEREDRFRRLMGLAADGYWELDARSRLTSAADRSGRPRPLQPGAGLGALPWELPEFSADADVLDELQADLDQRTPFRDRPVRWHWRDGRQSIFLVSGEPRFDARGVFIGYWGMLRDVTETHSAQQALAATETRYQELFSRIPTPLVLHRGGRIIDANPAAVALFGRDDLAALQGLDLLTLYESGDSRERARRRLEQLHDQPVGAALPVADFALTVAGQTVHVRATSVRVDADGGPAALAILVDDTERRAAEEAVRRSEALLSHLVQTSPDLIALTEYDSGRYTMVNQSFVQLSGWSADEAVGRSAAELGLWPDALQRQQFQRALQEQDKVSAMPARFVTRAGKPVSLLLSAARFVMDRREYVVINASDVTAFEDTRLEREAILANASIGIAVMRQQQFVLTNRHFELMYGWGPGELIGCSGATVWGGGADDVELGVLEGPALARGEPVELERTGRRKDGTSFIARMRGHAVDPSRPSALDGSTVWIVEDVTERRQFEQQLARARDDAEAASRAKSAFLATTSHELRTPLNGMIGLAQLARDEGVGEERRREYLDQIAQSAQSLAAIISDILDLSKIEAGKLQIETAPFDLGAEFESLRRSYATLAAAHGLELRIELSPQTHGLVRGDALRVRQIVSNFLTNAIKFTARGFVALSARRDGSRVRIGVQDSGPGLDAATRARLFQPFSQAEPTTARHFGGTGLGLSICHELATLMGGQVGVESRLGEGSTFWVELPLPPVATQAPPRPLPAPAAAAELAGRRVLVVEDNDVNMLIALAMLERWGVQGGQASDGYEALARLQQAAGEGRPFDAVLMDVHLPLMSGHDATRLLREAGHRQPVIALTAAALVSEREAALGAGMNDFLTKPIDSDKLYTALLYWCSPAPP